MARIVGIDYGAKRIGLAIADPVVRIAMPWYVLDGQNDPDKDAQSILQKIAAEREKVELFVIGLPQNMDGTEGPQAKLTRTFGQILAEKSGLPVTYHDERLSSYAAETLFRQPLKSHLKDRQKKKVKPKKPLDAVAAAVILGSYLQKSSSTP